jgi:hypothetical protein
MRENPGVQIRTHGDAILGALKHARARFSPDSARCVRGTDE